MKKVYKKDKKKFNYKSFVMIIVIFIISFLTIGFATSADELRLNGTAKIAGSKPDIRIKNFTLDNTANSATSQYEEHTSNTSTSTIDLPSQNATVTYEVQVANVGNVEAAFFGVTGLPENLDFTVTNYDLQTIMCDDTVSTKCKLGTTTTFLLTIGYKKNGYDSSNTSYNLELEYNFVSIADAIAQIDNKLYMLVTDAIADCPDNTQKTIEYLNDSNERIEVGQYKRIIFDLNGYTASVDYSSNVFINDGNITIKDGNLTLTFDQGVINNNEHGTLLLSNVNIDTRMRQCVYNLGNLTYENTVCYTYSSSRAAIQNIDNGVANIKSGTITADRYTAVINNATMTIGIDDGTMNLNQVIIKSSNYGIENNSNINFYDGIIKGKTRGLLSDENIDDYEDDYEISNSYEKIGNDTYHTSFLAINKIVTFSAPDGTPEEPTRRVPIGYAVGPLPGATRTGYELLGWYDSNEQKVREDRIINDDITFHAVWFKLGDVAIVEETKETFASLQDAVNAAEDGVTSTIHLLKNISAQVTIPATKDIVFDFDDFTLSNSGNKSVIEVNGNLTILSGKISSSAGVGAINVNSGSVLISGGSILATGSRQALYVLGGTVTITGNAYMTSKTDGAYLGVDRATVTNISGTVIITGGTIESSKQHAVSNASTLTIGVDDGVVSTTSPLLVGEKNAVKNTGTFYYYDGLLKGKTDALGGTLPVQNNHYTIINQRVDVYEEAHLEYTP